MSIEIHTKNDVVPITALRANDWNPKESIQDSAENELYFERIGKSLQAHGQIDPVTVRELDDGTYEIVDGFHRYTKMVEMGAKEIEVKNLGKITRQKAQAITLAKEDAKIPMNRIMGADLVKQLLDTDMSNLGLLPYSDEDALSMKKLVEFDFSQYEKGGDDAEDEREEKYMIELPKDKIQEWLFLKESKAIKADTELLVYLLEKSLP